MNDHFVIGSKTFSAHIVSENSFAATELGKHESTMTLYGTKTAGHAFIEWDIPAIEETVQIGLNFDVAKNLLDYDGVFSLPREAVALIRRHGFKVSEEFTS